MKSASPVRNAWGIPKATKEKTEINDSSSIGRKNVEAGSPSFLSIMSDQVKEEEQEKIQAEANALLASENEIDGDADLALALHLQELEQERMLAETALSSSNDEGKAYGHENEIPVDVHEYRQRFVVGNLDRHDPDVNSKLNTLRLQESWRFDDLNMGDLEGMISEETSGGKYNSPLWQDNIRFSDKAFKDLKKFVQKGVKKGISSHGRGAKEDHATKGGLLDNKTSLLMLRWINKGIVEAVHGVIKTGKEAAVFLCQKGPELDEHCFGSGKSYGNGLALKVFKPIQQFRNRGDYVVSDARYVKKKKLKISNQREALRLWCEKEYRNIVRAYQGKVPSPQPLLYNEHILLMSLVPDFIRNIPQFDNGAAQSTSDISFLKHKYECSTVPAPQLRDVMQLERRQFAEKKKKYMKKQKKRKKRKSHNDGNNTGDSYLPYMQVHESKILSFFVQCISILRQLYWSARLIHADFSEHNILVTTEEITMRAEPTSSFSSKESSKDFSSKDSSSNVPASSKLKPTSRRIRRCIAIDFAQAVETTHPDAERYLRRDITTIIKFFSSELAKTNTKHRLHVIDPQTFESKLTTDLIYQIVTQAEEDGPAPAFRDDILPTGDAIWNKDQNTQPRDAGDDDKKKDGIIVEEEEEEEYHGDKKSSSTRREIVNTLRKADFSTTIFHCANAMMKVYPELKPLLTNDS